MKKTRSIKNIKEIRDGYGWKFFKERIREELENRIDKVISHDYKLVLLADYEVVFSNEVNQKSLIESYIKDAEHGCIFSFYLITNHNEES